MKEKIQKMEEISKVLFYPSSNKYVNDLDNELSSIDIIILDLMED